VALPTTRNSRRNETLFLLENTKSRVREDVDHGDPDTDRNRNLQVPKTHWDRFLA
jgi:hypothetical protein